MKQENDIITMLGTGNALATRVSDIKNKTVEQLRKLKEIGVNEISLGVESGDDSSTRATPRRTSWSNVINWRRQASSIG